MVTQGTSFFYKSVEGNEYNNCVFLLNLVIEVDYMEVLSLGVDCDSLS